MKLEQPPELARSLYHHLLRIRLVEQTIAKYYADQEMRCPCHLSVGQEAAAVGICCALSLEDRVMSAHRAHAHYLAKGGDLNQMIAELYGKATGCTEGKGGSMHLVDLSVNFMGSTPIVGGTLPVAAGLAFGDQMASEERVSVAFVGEGATEEGVFAETLNYAALHSLPLIIVCEDNLYSSYSPLDVRQSPQRSRTQIAEAHGCLAFKGDGNRVDEVYELMRQALEHTRSGKGPVYIDLETYRWLEHCGPNYDNDLGYRTPQEAEAWLERCPLKYWEERLLEAGLLEPAEIQQMKSRLCEEIETAFQLALNAPIPEAKELYTHVYA